MTLGADTGTRHWAPLDGVRALAIALVVAYHLGGLGGGWIGVDIFFILSGFLITSLLRAESGSTGTIRLAAFWGRRAKRLLPAVVLLLLVLSVYAWAKGPGVVPAQLRAPALATMFYGANWQEISAGHNYFAAFSAPNPLQHTWSLAIEEQYYLVWPLLLGVVLLPRWRGSVRKAIGLAAALVLISTVWMGFADHIWGLNRAYLGTDTRAWELLLGGVAALCFPPGAPSRRRPAQPGEPARPGVSLWPVIALIGVAGVAVVVSLANRQPGWLWDGGLFAAGLATVAVLVACTRAGPERNPVASVLSLGPVRWLGLISYSLYLWHWPVIVVLNAQTAGFGGAGLLAARLAAMTALACASYYVVERPLRRLDWGAWWKRSLVPVAIGGTTVALLAATVTPVQATGAPLALPAGTPTTRPSAPQPRQVAAASPVTPPVTSALARSHSGPWRVWILGDSVIADASPGITAALQSTGSAQVVVNSSFGGWGLTTDHVWPSDAEHDIATYHPQIVIGTWSWDDGEAAQDPAAYEARLQQALSVLLQPGNGVQLVVLLQFPQTGPSSYVTDPATQHADWAKETAQQDAWNSLAQQATTAFPGKALYLQTSALFAPGGRFMEWMRDADGAWVRARKVDRAHMCPYGAAEFGALVTDDLSPVLGLGPMQPGWELAAWTHDPRYNDPPGACPADQPSAGYDGLVVPTP
jgi:peptidoglycan/LPS O-acetylase OafA/YrhL